MNYDDEANTETEAPEPDMNAEIRRAAGHDTQLQPELGWRPSSPPEDRINALERERDGLVRGLAETSEALKIAENQAADGDRLYAGLRLNYERATQQLLELEDAHHVRRRDAREERDARMALQTAVDEINALATMLIDAQAATKIDLRRRLHAIHVKAAYALDTAERFLNPRSSTGGPTIYPEPTERPRRSPARKAARRKGARR